MTTRGFTLLEMLVATAIMAVAVVSVMAGLQQSSKNASRLTQNDRATILARHVMDDVLANHTIVRGAPLQGVFAPQESGGVEAGWQARVMVFEALEGAGPGFPVVDRAEVTVWWMDGAVRRSFSLEGYRRSVLPVEGR